MTVPGSAATEAVSDAAPAGVIAPPPLRWAAAVARVAGELDRDLVVARAGGVADADLAEGLRAVGAPFERWLDHQPGIAASEEVSDQWAAGWARTVVRLVSARRFGDASIARWVLLWVAPVVTVDLRDTTPAVLDDLVEAATRLSGSGDVTAWARAVEAGVRAWPSGMPFTRGRLRELAGVAAWRAGHVRLRTAALAAAASLPVAVSAATLGATEDQLAAALPDNATHPLRWPGVDDAPRRIGAFRGFGGAWLLPPVVRGGNGLRWAVVSGEDHFTVLTDAFGTAVLPAPLGRPEDGFDALTPSTRPSWWDDLGDDVTGAAHAPGQVLVSHAHSHRLTLLSQPDEPAPVQP